MGLMDAFTAEDRVNLKVNDLIKYFRSEARTNAENEVLINGLKAGINYEDILVMTGKLDTDCIEKTETNEN